MRKLALKIRQANLATLLSYSDLWPTSGQPQTELFFTWSEDSMISYDGQRK